MQIHDELRRLIGCDGLVHAVVTPLGAIGDESTEVLGQTLLGRHDIVCIASNHVIEVRRIFKRNHGVRLIQRYKNDLGIIKEIRTIKEEKRK